MKRRVLLDFHSHILPYMDDGAQHPRQSLSMLLAERASGITDVCLSSHYYAEENSVSAFLNRRQFSYDSLRREIKKSTRRLPNLHLSSEVHFFPGMAEEPLLHLLCCGASDLILVEPPMRVWDDAFYGELDRLRAKRGLQPVIAHLDRYISFLEDSSLVSAVRSRGYLVQFNIEAFLDRDFREYSCELLRFGKIDFLGSDAHDLTSRPVEMKEFVRLLEKESLLDRFVSLSEKGVQYLRGVKNQ